LLSNQLVFISRWALGLALRWLELVSFHIYSALVAPFSAGL
jgi:hypothetical protein